VTVDCATLPEQLIENELFGHERGAFTGADQTADGKVLAANGGTLFLDEIADIPSTSQGKLLRLLQERAYSRVGGTKAIRADVRFVSATHRDLERQVESGQLREDLYYRLCVVQIAIPPLRSRGAADLDRLIDHFLFEFKRSHSRPKLSLSDPARRALHLHVWPGNVRELRNCLEASVVLASGPVIAPIHLRFVPGTSVSQVPGSNTPLDAFVSEIQPLKELETAYVKHVLEACDGNRSAAARVLGIGRNTLLRKLRGQ
jgi:Nif-specific regulatory protein